MKKGTIIAIAVLLLLTGGALVVFANIWASGLTVSSIQVVGNAMVDKNEILQLAQVTPGTRLGDLDLMEIQRNVGSHYYFRDVVVERDLPSTLRIRVFERSPLAIVSSGSLTYIDPDGIVLPRMLPRELFDLPVLSGVPSAARLSAGERVTDPRVQEALQILETAKEMGSGLYHSISEVQIQKGGDIVLYTAERGVPVLFGRGDVARKLVHFETFWNEIVSLRGPQQLGYVDLRFNDQIVVRWNDASRLRSL